jgi:hypothetical protein
MNEPSFPDVVLYSDVWILTTASEIALSSPLTIPLMTFSDVFSCGIKALIDSPVATRRKAHPDKCFKEIGLADTSTSAVSYLFS